MARRPKPWFWKQSKTWAVTIDGKRYVLGPDKEAAETKFHELMADPNRNVKGDTLIAVFDMFLDWVEKKKAHETFLWYRKHLTSFLAHYGKLKLLPATELRAHHIEKWTDSHAWNDGTVRGAMTAVARAMNWAEKMGHIELNPIRRKLDKPAAGKRERVVSEQEYKAVLKKVSKAFGDLITIAWETGARPQETCRVEARHVDLKNGRWVFPVQESKGKKIQRIVYLTDKALAITKRLMKKHPTGKLFRTHHGNPWNRHSVSEAFASLKRRTKAETKYRLYDFRHSYITHGLKREVDPVTMATLAGHQDLTMIHKIYSHISQDVAHMRKMAKRAVG